MSRELFRALWDVGLDRSQLSIHEMLTDILEVVAVAQGSKPAHLAGQGEGAAWRLAAFERAAGAFGLRVLRTAPVTVPDAHWDRVADEFPVIAAALRSGGTRVHANAPTYRVLWIFRSPALVTAIERLVAGEAALVPEVLGYPPCCAEHDAGGEAAFVRAITHLYRAQHGIRDEAALIAAMQAGVAIRPDARAGVALQAVWSSRLVFPYLGYTACPACLAQPASSPSGLLNRAARALAFRLDAAYARGLWQAALGEAALVTRGDFRALNPGADDSCPCGSGFSHAACCSGRPSAMPEFR